MTFRIEKRVYAMVFCDGENCITRDEVEMREPAELFEKQFPGWRMNIFTQETFCPNCK